MYNQIAVPVFNPQGCDTKIPGVPYHTSLIRSNLDILMSRLGHLADKLTSVVAPLANPIGSRETNTVANKEAPLVEELLRINNQIQQIIDGTNELASRIDL